MKMVLLFILSFLISYSPAFAQEDMVEELLRNLQLQVWLDRAGFSPGEIDAEWGPNTEKALYVFQTANKLPKTGTADDRTLAALRAAAGRGSTMKTYRITAADMRGPFVEEIPDDYMLKAKLPHMSYTSPLEAISEKFHVHPNLLLYLNPQAWIKPGEIIQVPNVANSVPRSKVKVSPVAPVKGPNQKPEQPPAKSPDQKTAQPLRVIISDIKSDLMVTRAGRIIFYAPISHGGEHDPVPVGKKATITAVTANPIYRYNPKLFWDADPKHTRAIIRPGPNNPVGVAWISLSLPHYGIHGTPNPSAIGYGESHGCIRMTNWDILKLAGVIQMGTEVVFQ
jgi:lipoprotein-anchoring transpeptidase ErfK/SrfK